MYCLKNTNVYILRKAITQTKLFWHKKPISPPNYRTEQVKSRSAFDREIKEGDFMNMEKLREMKKHMALRGNWKEVKRINKMIEFHGI